MHRFIAGILFSTIGLFAGSAAAQGYPSHPVRIVVPFPAGGTTDIVARLVGVELQRIWGQPVVVENRAGAGGSIGAELVAKSPNDGYTLLMGTVGTHSINLPLYAQNGQKLPYHPRNDFAPITNVAAVPNVMVVPASLPANNVKEFIALAKSRPGGLNMASSGNGTSIHLTAWFGLLAPAGTSRDIVNKIRNDVAKALESADLRERFAGQGALPVADTPEQFTAYIRGEIEKWTRVVKFSGAKID